jgi:uncharacterized membrane protein
MKKHALISLIAAVLMAAATPVSAACFADYKAKRDNPLQLHYGVLQLSDAACQDGERAEAEARARVNGANWTFLGLVSVFREDGLNERKESAGEFFLRF